MITAPAISRPIRLPNDPRPLRQVVVGNVPGEVNTFVGRERELNRLRELHDEARLLTLVGPGGVGKTRLALRLEADVRGVYADGTWLVDLSPITDPALVPQALGDVLGVQQQPGLSWLGELTRALRARRVLLILDNCEHLIAACAELVEGLLRSCADVRLLATSQQPLGAAGETIWRVPPLLVPPAGVNQLDQVRSNEAVQLFVTRVRAHQPDFALGPHNAPVIADICRRLDGLPLALELVAARIATLGVAEAAARLGDRVALAVGQSHTAPTRRQTLGAALEWSFSLLSREELTLLRRLSVFVGGWTLEAAEAVCGTDDLSAATRVVDTLEQLVAKSLVIADHGELTVRYRLLEMVRAHARSQLDAAGETAALQRRHAEFALPPGGTSLGHARLDLGQTSAALKVFNEALHDARASGERVRIIRALEGYARCIADVDADAAVRLAGATDRARASLGAALWPSERRYFERWSTSARRVLGSSAYQRAWEDGHASTLDQAISMAEAFRAEPLSISSVANTLSPREREVAILLARGLTNKQVAAELVLSPATVRSHVEHILAKLDLHSRAQIGVWASQQGLLIDSIST
jgi:predicted ATPase/DNA-binding CsgD family transcriptional regulator